MATLTYTGINFFDVGDNNFYGYSLQPQNVPNLLAGVNPVALTLTGLDHTHAADLDILLISPDGRKLMVMSDVAGGADFEDATITLSDAATQTLPATPPPDGVLVGGSYRPLAVGEVETLGDFSQSGSAINHATGTGSVGFASTFGGVNPNGTWFFYIRDDASGDTGRLDALSLSITFNGSTMLLSGPTVSAPVAIQVLSSSATAGRYFINDQSVGFSGMTGFYLEGGFQGDLLIGGAGNDTLRGAGGIDRLYGGAGNDILEVNSQSGASGEVLDGGAGTDRLSMEYAGSGNLDLRYATLTGIEALQLTAFVPDTQRTVTLTATQLAGITGLSGAGGAGSDIVEVRMRSAGSLTLGTLATTGMTDAGDRFVVRGDSDAEAISGTARGDSLFGRGGADSLFGGAGNDVLFGGGGTDSLRGGAGADSLDGGLGSDSADYSTSATGVTVRLWNGTGAGGDAQGDALTGVEHVTGSALGDSLIGDDLAGNWLTGGGGTDYINGLGGADRLNGQSGNDTLEGGNGADQFVFGLGYGHDRVVQFVDGVDKVDLVGLTFAQFSEATFGTGVRLTGTGAAAGLILDLMGVTMAQVEAGDFI